MKNRLKIRKNKLKLTTLAFTLIELLAIIVILAIIAVITIPILLNVIENSRKGAATDSAYGYKDSVNKFYIAELQNHNKLKLDGTYTVNSDGSLEPTEDNEFGFGDNEYGNSLDVAVSGTIPSSGSLTYSNNVLTNGCLVFGDYAVTFDGNETSTVKGTCPENSQQGGGTTPVAFIYASKGDTETKTLSNIAVGDYVTLGNDGFYVIGVPQSITSGIPTYNQVLLMSEYNISNTATDATAAWRQESSNNYEKPRFSEEYYWENCVAIDSEPTGCTKLYGNLYADEFYGFIYDNHSNLYDPIENYKDYLQTATGVSLTARPMSYDEANAIISNSWAYNQSYYLGSEAHEDYWSGPLYEDCVSHVDSTTSNLSFRSYTYSDDDCNFDLDYDAWVNSDGDGCYQSWVGIRPVIEISTSAFL